MLLGTTRAQGEQRNNTYVGERAGPEGSFSQGTQEYQVLLCQQKRLFEYILYVQEVVTLQKKYFNIFASENCLIILTQCGGAQEEC